MFLKQPAEMVFRSIPIKKNMEDGIFSLWFLSNNIVCGTAEGFKILTIPVAGAYTSTLQKSEGFSVKASRVKL